MFKKYLALLSIIISLASYLPAEEIEVSPYHILYLAKSKQYDLAIKTYLSIKEAQKKHLPDILESLCLVILEQGIESKDEHEQLLSLYGASLAGIDALYPLCEKAFQSKQAMIHLIAVQMAGQLHDDRTIPLLTSCFSSPFLGIRMEAAFALAQRKHPSASGYIESLMAKLPPFFHRYFPPLFALIGTKEATIVLKKLLRDLNPETRIQTILTAAEFKRDDLLGDIRNALTHINAPEQEACLTALGLLGDSSSIATLEKHAKSDDPHISLVAMRSLLALGQKQYLQNICDRVKDKDLFAMHALASIEGGQDALAEHIKHPQSSVRFNAAAALLKKKDSRCIQTVIEMLLSEKKDLGYAPGFSPGRALMYWKVVPSVSIHSKKDPDGALLSMSIGFREHLLTECLELPEKDFLSIAETLFQRKQLDMIPLLTHLLINIKSEEVITFFKRKAEEVGSPFTRMYATLALCILKQDSMYEERLLDWIKKEQHVDIIQFRPTASKITTETQFHYQLTPLESARLLIESLMYFSEKHDESSLDLLVNILSTTAAKNRIVLSGLILKTLQ